MIDRNHIETLLRIHGVSPTAPEDDIRALLRSAQYNSDEIETAIGLLHNISTELTSRVEGLHKIYRTDTGLAPREVSALLGIDIDISEVEIRNHRRRGLSGGQNFLVLALAVSLAFSAVLYAMYEHETGPFHPSAQFTSR